MTPLNLPHRLILIRHGETDWNREGRLQGSQDIPLNALGRGQAAETADRLRAIAPHWAELDKAWPAVSSASMGLALDPGKRESSSSITTSISLMRS